jgi:hypothetical protein
MAMVKPKLCSDGYTYGFDRWSTLKEAVQEVNAISAERYLQWNAFFALADTFTGTFDDDSLYYEEDVVLTICPTTLKAGGPFINAESYVDCGVVRLMLSSLCPGPHARNILVRGVHFKRTCIESGLQDGAEHILKVAQTGNHATQSSGQVDVTHDIINFICH